MPRLSINISEDTALALKTLANEHETSVTDIVRRAVAVYDYIETQTKDDKRLQLVDKNNHVTTVALVS